MSDKKYFLSKSGGQSSNMSLFVSHCGDWGGSPGYIFTDTDWMLLMAGIGDCKYIVIRQHNYRGIIPT